MLKCFLSYRRSDAIVVGTVGRIYDRLVQQYGEGHAFMDLEDIPPGRDFRAVLVEAVTKADVLLAVIGTQWNEIMRQRRAESDDFVRIEIESALQQGIPVVPVLVGGAAMPQPEDLPQSIRKMAYCNAVSVDPGRDFHTHATRLLEDLECHYGGGEKPDVRGADSKSPSFGPTRESPSQPAAGASDELAPLTAELIDGQPGSVMSPYETGEVIGVDADSWQAGGLVECPVSGRMARLPEELPELPAVAAKAGTARKLALRLAVTIALLAAGWYWYDAHTSGPLVGKRGSDDGSHDSVGHLHVLVPELEIASPADARVELLDHNGIKLGDVADSLDIGTGFYQYRLDHPLKQEEFRALKWPLRLVVSAEDHLAEEFVIDRRQVEGDEGKSKVELPVSPTPISLKPAYLAQAVLHWSGTRYTVPVRLLQVEEADREHVEIRDADDTADQFRIVHLQGVHRDFSLVLQVPGFQPLTRKVDSAAGEPIDFGELVRPKGAINIVSHYGDNAEVYAAHSGFIGKLVLTWKSAGVSSDPLANQLLAAQPAAGEFTVDAELPKKETRFELQAGRYQAHLLTACQVPFERIFLGEVDVESGGLDAVPVSVPIVPIGLFGGQTAWTYTLPDGTDAEGAVSWNFYNLPAEFDLPGLQPRMVMGVSDFDARGEVIKRVYLPAPISNLVFSQESKQWSFDIDPHEILAGGLDRDIKTRYYEKKTFTLSDRSDHVELLFVAETNDQPRNTAKGKPRSIQLRNAYLEFQSALPAIDTPGVGVVNLNEVYRQLKDKADAPHENFRRSISEPCILPQQLAIRLGFEFDPDFRSDSSIRVAEVEPGGPAADAGIRVGDLLVELAGKKIDGLNAFFSIRFSLTGDTSYAYKVSRNQKIVEATIAPEWRLP